MLGDIGVAYLCFTEPMPQTCLARSRYGSVTWRQPGDSSDTGDASHAQVSRVAAGPAQHDVHKTKTVRTVGPDASSPSAWSRTTGDGGIGPVVRQQSNKRTGSPNVTCPTCRFGNHRIVIAAIKLEIMGVSGVFHPDPREGVREPLTAWAMRCEWNACDVVSPIVFSPARSSLPASAWMTSTGPPNIEEPGPVDDAKRDIIAHRATRLISEAVMKNIAPGGAEAMSRTVATR